MPASFEPESSATFPAAPAAARPIAPKRARWADAMSALCLAGVLIPAAISDLATPGFTAILHVLAATAFILAAYRHWRLSSPRLYWSGFDLTVLALFVWWASTIHFSEIRELTWSAVSRAGWGLAAYLVGRFVFWRHLGWMAAMLVIGGIAAAVIGDAPAFGVSIVDDRWRGVSGLGLITAVFWAIAGMLVLVRRPPPFTGTLLIAASLTMAALTGYRFAVALLTPGSELGHRMLAGATTALALIRTYPIAGTGFGTWEPLAAAWGGPATVGPAPGAFATLAAESGTLAAACLLVLLVVVPIQAWRMRYRYPFQRLRVAIAACGTFCVITTLHAVCDSAILSPFGWMVTWLNLGTLASLFLIRDPARAFHQADDLQTSGTGSTFGLALRTLAASMALAAALLPYGAEKLAARVDPAQIPTASDVNRLRLSARVFPASAQAWSRLADAEARAAAGKPQTFAVTAEIEANLRRAVDANPYDPARFEQLFYFYRDANDIARALTTLRQGVRYNPNHVTLRLLLVRELERGGSLGLATWHLKRAALALAPGQTDLLVRLAELYEQRGLPDQAKRWWQYARQSGQPSQQYAARLRRLGERLGLLPAQTRR